MELLELITKLDSTRARLAEEKIEEIDFSELAHDLGEAGATLQLLAMQAETGRKLVSLFKEELATRARAIARLKGESSSLTEKLIRTENISLDELLTLKQELTAEFDRVFAHKLTEPAGPAGKGEDAAQFKT